MKIEDKKLEIIHWLINVEDESVLSQIDLLRKFDKEKIAPLSKEELEAIEEGLQELNEGKGISHEHVINELREKYNP